MSSRGRGRPRRRPDEPRGGNAGHHRVAVVIEASNAYARGLLAGIHRHVREHEPFVRVELLHDLDHHELAPLHDRGEHSSTHVGRFDDDDATVARVGDLLHETVLDEALHRTGCRAGVDVHGIGQVTHADRLMHDDSLESVELARVDREFLVLEDEAAQLAVGGTAPDLAPHLADAVGGLAVEVDTEVDGGLRLLSHQSLG